MPALLPQLLAKLGTLPGGHFTHWWPLRCTLTLKCLPQRGALFTGIRTYMPFVRHFLRSLCVRPCGHGSKAQQHQGTEKHVSPMQ